MTLLDASPNPGGLSAGWRTKQGRAVEAGVKGFWYQASPRGHFLLMPRAADACLRCLLAMWMWSMPLHGIRFDEAAVCALQYANIFQLVKELDIEWCAIVL